MSSMRRLWFIIAALGWSGAGWAGAADWTTAVFPERSHDFGTVARGSKVRYSFPVINSTDRNIHIKSWRPKCACTDVRLGARDVPPGTQTVVEAVIDTTNFTGLKASGLVLNIDRPEPLDIDLSVTCFIRADLTLTPGLVDFGVVNRSAGPQAELNLTYAGAQTDWAIASAFTVSEHVTAKLTEQSRSPGGAVTYHLSVKLNPTVPVGFFKDEITLKTNDPTGPNLPVSVAAVVQSNVTVTPSVINMGAVRPGETVQKSFLVRAAQPFKIVAVESRSPDLVVAAPPDQAKPLHSLTFTFKAPTSPGAFNAAVEIQTDLKDEPPTRLMTFATIVP